MPNGEIHVNYFEVDNATDRLAQMVSGMQQNITRIETLAKRLTDVGNRTFEGVAAANFNTKMSDLNARLTEHKSSLHGINGATIQTAGSNGDIQLNDQAIGKTFIFDA